MAYRDTSEPSLMLLVPTVLPAKSSNYKLQKHLLKCALLCAVKLSQFWRPANTTVVQPECNLLSSFSKCGRFTMEITLIVLMLIYVAIVDPIITLGIQRCEINRSLRDVHFCQVRDFDTCAAAVGLQSAQICSMVPVHMWCGMERFTLHHE